MAGPGLTGLPEGLLSSIAWGAMMNWIADPKGENEKKKVLPMSKTQAVGSGREIYGSLLYGIELELGERLWESRTVIIRSDEA
jgi:hypothetical protein